jgi:hypothetical protein
MKASQAVLALGVALCAAPPVMQAQADDAPPAWTYPVNPPDFKVQPDDGTQRHVPDSSAAFTVTQARDLFFALDWHPSDHPALPDIVARGRRPDVMASRRVPPSGWAGRAGKCRHCWPSRTVHPAADGRLQKRRVDHLGPATNPAATDDQDGEGYYRYRKSNRRRPIFLG